MKNKTSVMHRV